jgi:fructose-bisphosphate aldolase, class II
MGARAGHVEAARALMGRSRAEHFSVGAFNVDNLETLVAIAQAAQAKKAPVLAEVSQSEVEAIGLANLRDLVDNFREELEIEMYLNLDHSPSVAAATAGIEAGFEFVHIDYSQANRDATEEEIVVATKEVVAAAAGSGALVESEPRYFHGSSNVLDEEIDYEEVKATFSTPDGARDFVEATGVDTFAAAVGNLHGRYPTPKRLDLDLLRAIREAIDVNISLHGGSGTPGHYFEEAARIGVSKVNLNSDLRYAYRTGLEKALAENPDEYAVVRLMGPVIAALRKVVEDHIDLYGSAGKAIR